MSPFDSTPPPLPNTRPAGSSDAHSANERPPRHTSTEAWREQCLFRAWRAGNARAGTALFRLLRPKLLHYFRHCSPHLAEDLTHDTLMAFVAGRDALREERALRRYLYCVAKRTLMRALFRNDVEFVPLDEGTTSRGMVDFIDLSRIDVQRLLTSHSTRCTETLAEYYLTGRRAPEIAQARKMGVNTVRSQIRHGLTQLRRSVVER